MRKNSEMRQEFLAERLVRWCRVQIKRNSVPLTSAVVAGFLAYMFAFTNKLVNHDEVGSLFIKGDTVSSGRWGLELMSLVMPDYSMPWIYGVIGVVVMAVAACVICRVFGIRSRILRILLPALIVTFPSMTGTYAYMFTSSSYAVAFLLAVLAVYFMARWRRKYLLPAFLCMVFSLSIYQSYVSVTASLLVLVVIHRLLEGDKTGSLLIRGVSYVLFLGISLAVYFVLTKIIQAAMGVEMNAYAAQNFNFRLSDIPYRVSCAYRYFRQFFLTGSHGVIPTAFSRYIHIGSVLIILAELLVWAVSSRKPGRIALLAFLLGVLPLSVNCMYLFTSEESIHTLVLYGFVSVYVLLAMVIEKRRDTATHVKFVNKCRALGFEAVVFAMAIVIAVNTYVANEAYLNLYLRYENTYTFYSNVINRIMDDPGFDSESRIAMVGAYSPPEAYNGRFEEISQIMGVAGVNPQSWSNYLFLGRYMGFDIPFASQEEIQTALSTPEFAQMSVYPYYGSIRKIGNVFVVRLQ